MLDQQTQRNQVRARSACRRWEEVGAVGTRAGQGSEADVLQSLSIPKRAHLMDLVYLVHREKGFAKVQVSVRNQGATSCPFWATGAFGRNVESVALCSVFWGAGFLVTQV